MLKLTKKTVLGIVWLIILIGGCEKPAHDPQIFQRWQSVLPAPAVPVSIEIAIRQSGDGQLSANISIPEENIDKLPVTQIHRDGDQLSLAVPELALFFNGLLGEADAFITGDAVRGRQRLPLVFNKQSGETGMTGDWRGTLRFPGKLLHLTIELSSNWSGDLSGKFFSPELNAQNVPLDDVRVNGPAIEFSSHLLDGKFSGKFNKNKSMFDGDWRWQRAGISNNIVFDPVPPLDSLMWQLPESLNDGWEIAAPESTGMRMAPIDSLFSALRRSEFPDVNSLLVAHRGKLVLEIYPEISRRGMLRNLDNATLGITALLCGIAIEKGYLSGVDQPVFPLLREFAAIENPDPQKSQITIKQLLTMTSGLGCNDWSRTALATEDKLLRGRNWVKLMLDLPAAFPPGEAWSFCAGNGAVLGAALENATRTRLEHFALRNLFEPLGIDELSWGVSPEGRAYGGGMLMLTTRAMGKIGQLVLENGRRNELQIVPENWITQMCAPQAEAWGENAPAPNYGFGWWQTEIAGVRTVFAMGKGGQYIVAVPDAQLVAVFSGGDAKPVFDPKPLEILEKYLIPACP